MDLYLILADVRSRIEWKLPEYASFDDVVSDRYQDIYDLAMEKLTFALEQAILGAFSILKTTADEYIQALDITDDFQITIKDEGKHLEYGYGPFDMKESLLTGPRSRVSKDGDLYNVIPIGAKKKGPMNVSNLFPQLDPTSSHKLSNMVSFINHGPQETPPDRIVTVSSKSKGWQHPGFSGVNQLDSINFQLKVDLVESISDLILREVARRRR